MPKWGLTKEMRATEPYGLPEEMLAPAKVVTDPVHGDIRLMEIERRIVDSPCFQRLRRVRQLGTTHLAYPAATHTRFSHSLGALAAAQMLFDIAYEQRNEREPHLDVFMEWQEQARTSDRPYLRRVAEAIVLTRLGALLHDLCHIPFGHTVEDELCLLVPHDENLERFQSLWEQIDDDVKSLVSGGVSESGKRLDADLQPLILSKLKTGAEPEEGEDVGAPDITYPFAQDIVGNTVSADLIDYLSRDHLFTGLPAAVGHRFLDSFYISPSTDPFKPERMVLRIVKAQRERKDNITELLKFLRYRYELSERALAHHAKLAADAMVGKLLQMYFDACYVMKLDEIALTDQELRTALEGLSRGDLDAVRKRASSELGKKRHRALEDDARAMLESTMLRHGDDGLLEFLRDEGDLRKADDSRWSGIHQLAGELLDRRLFKQIARLSDRSHAKRLWKDLGKDPDRRRQVEQVAARAADLPHAWLIVLWVPPERMRLKPALVLVDDGELIDTLLLRERSPRGRGRGTDIYDAHRDLWSLYVFADRTVRDNDQAREAVLAVLAEELHLSNWEDPTSPVSEIAVALETAVSELDLSPSEATELRTLVPTFLDGSADVSGFPPLRELVDELKQAWNASRGDAEESVGAVESGSGNSASDELDRLESGPLGPEELPPGAQPELS